MTHMKKNQEINKRERKEKYKNIKKFEKFIF